MDIDGYRKFIKIKKYLERNFKCNQAKMFCNGYK